MKAKDKLKAKIWRKNRNAVAKKPHRKNLWNAMKDQLINEVAKLSYHYQSEPTDKEIKEYQVYWELIALCTSNSLKKFVS